LVELGRVPALVDPLGRTASRLLDAIVAGRIEACRGAHQAYWLGTEELGRLSVAIDDAPPLVRDLVGFIQLADECEEHVLNDRDDVRDNVRQLAQRILDKLSPDPG
jgi:hypothetical protein